MFDVPCVILCGGKSSRMGEDKALLPFKEYNSLCQYQYEKLKPYFSDIYLSSKIDKFDFEAKIIFDEYEEFSPLHALKSILTTLNTSAYVISVDTPFVEIDTIKKLYEEYKKEKSLECVYAKGEFSHYLCSIISNKIIDKIEKNINSNNFKLGYLIKNINSKSIFFNNELQFTNINTKEDYNKAIKYKKL